MFRKPTFSGVFANFDSFVPISYKHSLVNTLIFRCCKICSSYEKLHNKIVYLKEIFKRNSYPDDFVDLCIKKFFDKLYITKKIYQTVEKKQLIIYKFSFGCCNTTYYGQTERHLFVRASEHLGITPLTQKRVKNLKKSAIMDHLLLAGHNAAYDNFSIPIPENNQFK